MAHQIMSCCCMHVPLLIVAPKLPQGAVTAFATTSWLLPFFQFLKFCHFAATDCCCCFLSLLLIVAIVFVPAIGWSNFSVLLWSLCCDCCWFHYCCFYHAGCYHYCFYYCQLIVAVLSLLLFCHYQLIVVAFVTLAVFIAPVDTCCCYHCWWFLMSPVDCWCICHFWCLLSPDCFFCHWLITACDFCGSFLFDANSWLFLLLSQLFFFGCHQLIVAAFVTAGWSFVATCLLLQLFCCFFQILPLFLFFTPLVACW